jgi:LPXTG-site transpeptidase (sortase) family protein
MTVLCLLTCLCGCTAQAGVSTPAVVTSRALSRRSPPHARVGLPPLSGSSSFQSTSPSQAGRVRQCSQRPQSMVCSSPENVRHVGWWDGSAHAGEAFGSTVIAGHVDSDTYGIGFFARLLRIKVGDTVTLRGKSHRLRYRVTSVKEVPKKALATQSQAFQQTGPHRLVLITCTGNFHRDRGGYDSNLVVVAKPVGSAR